MRVKKRLILLTMSRACAKCNELIQIGDEYVAYGGLCWCGYECLAKHVASDTNVGGKGLEEIDEKSEVRTLE